MMLTSLASKGKCEEYMFVVTLEHVLGLRPTISFYLDSQRDGIWKAYISKGPFQPQFSKCTSVKQLLTLINQHPTDYQCIYLDCALKNATMTSPNIHKYILRAMISCVLEHIVKQIGDNFFCLLIDDAQDESTREQMSLILRSDRFLDMIHVADTRSDLRTQCYSRHGLLLSRVRGQVYDEASNMCENINGLKTIIRREVPSVYYVHCFAHRLQFALMSIVKNHIKICRFFVELSSICVTICASCKRADYFDFVLMLHIMKSVLSKSVILSKALEHKNQDILNFIDLVIVRKYELQEMSSKEGWKTIYEAIQSFCFTINNVEAYMESSYLLMVRLCRNADYITYNHYYRVEIFFNVVDSQLKELMTSQNGDGYLAHAISLFVETKLAQGITTDNIINKFHVLSTRGLQMD
ncbi:hypothetical protein MPTK1_4g17540 [Marchantia polymorpha subsp. ruderalis]|uniref:DUF4371 domain-containing protein n=2 Tax=Marchantia polymorpha TaxID=3197 RepID=A0AAF6BAW2_MARPO|nr:hypothetical protein MARPO_0041s0036 [Marchantia polymorpha]BBN09146.1 hypothetical protein Mp_4g17540 [Marchantia polymorpha subsp. ruderalis]|eukprot:PTQ40134.1 hypothetical protein MARPO_0041s0036 [Marchantia polymorpha]